MDRTTQARAAGRLARLQRLACIAGLLLAPLAAAQADLEAQLAVTASGLAPDGSDHVEYAMSVANAGSSHAQAVKVLMRLPDEFVDPAWTCVAEGGARCGLDAGAGDVLFETEMPPGAAVRFALVTGVADPRGRGVWLAVETVTASAEPDTGDNDASVVYQRCSASAELAPGDDPPDHPCAFVDSFEPL